MRIVRFGIATVFALGTLWACGEASTPSAAETIAVPAEGRVTIQTAFDEDVGDWEFPAGHWEQRHSGGESVLLQSATDAVFPVALWNAGAFSDVDVTVRFKPISGRIDASGGIIVRALDGGNCYVVRANSLENNFRLYTVIDGRRSQIASARVTAPTLGAWHTLRVVAVGPRIQAYLDGAALLDHRDERFTSGRVGLWTKADAVTEFDDLTVIGVPARTD